MQLQLPAFLWLVTLMSLLSCAVCSSNCAFRITYCNCTLRAAFHPGKRSCKKWDSTLAAEGVGASINAAKFGVNPNHEFNKESFPRGISIRPK